MELFSFLSIFITSLSRQEQKLTFLDNFTKDEYTISLSRRWQHYQQVIHIFNV